MTAEIAILNRSAIALAADSAVTIQKQKGALQGEKIYNTVNKLFTLSKFKPVGIMVYGDADLMGFPWETIIKIYRKRLGKKSFGKLHDYAMDLIKYLDRKNALFPKSEQVQLFNTTVYSYFHLIKSNIDQDVDKKLKSSGSISRGEIRRLVEKQINEHYDRWEKYKPLSHLPKGYPTKLRRKFSVSISKIQKDVFEKLPINKQSATRLSKIASNLFFKNFFPANISGVVIAGFGDNETFPSITLFQIEGVVNNRLKYAQKVNAKIDFKSSAQIYPFAQREMVDSFMSGIHPEFKETLDGYLSRLFDRYPEILIDNIIQTNTKQKKKLKDKLKQAGQIELTEFKNKLMEHQKKNHIDPVLEAVSFLPKDELAAMAESLVNLTSFKRRMSLDAETVGGPIDVAVISKGDGFIWIKRKHYFKPDLNPHFFERYFDRKENKGK